MARETFEENQARLIAEAKNDKGGTPPVDAGSTTPPANDTLDFDFTKMPEDKLFGYLSEKTGKEVKSYEDLFTEKEIEKEVTKEIRKYNSPEAEAYDKYFLETGRSVSDFAKLNKDWTKESDSNVVLEYLKQENPYLSAEDVKFQLEDKYQKPESLDPDEHEPHEVAAREREIKRKDIELKQLTAQAKQFLQDNKAKYIDPIENKSQTMQQQAEQGRETWQKGVVDSLPSNVEFGDFNYEIKDADTYKQELSTLEGVFKKFKGEDGQIDSGKLAKTLMMGEKALNGELLGDYAKHVKANVLKEQMQEKSGSTPKVKDIPVAELQSVKEQFMQSLKKNNFSL